MNIRTISDRKVAALLGSTALVSAVLPAFTSAQRLIDALGVVNTLLNALIGVMVVMAIVVFFWGLVKYLWGASSENAHDGINLMIWGVGAIFVMVSVWGLIRLLQRTFGVEQNTIIVPQGVPLQIR